MSLVTTYIRTECRNEIEVPALGITAGIKECVVGYCGDKPNRTGSNPLIKFCVDMPKGKKNVASQKDYT